MGVKMKTILLALEIIMEDCVYLHIHYVPLACSRWCSFFGSFSYPFILNESHYPE
jgi:hypothetical protein